MIDAGVWCVWRGLSGYSPKTKVHGLCVFHLTSWMPKEGDAIVVVSTKHEVGCVLITALWHGVSSTVRWRGAGGWLGWIDWHCCHCCFKLPLESPLWSLRVACVCPACGGRSTAMGTRPETR